MDDPFKKEDEVLVTTNLPRRSGPIDSSQLGWQELLDIVRTGEVFSSALIPIF